MKFHSRSDWGARAPEHRSSIGDVYGCTVHWHGPGLGSYDHGDCPGLLLSMQDFHMDSNGWSDLGYSFVCCRHGHVWEGRGLGVRGAHDESLNEHWYGIQAMVGEDDTITAALLAGLVDAIAYCRQGGAGDRINAHRDADNTACPGDELYAWAHGSPMEDDMPTPEEFIDARVIDDPRRYPKGEGKDPSVDQMSLAQVLRDLLEGQQTIVKHAIEDKVEHGTPQRKEVRAIAKALEALASGQDQAIRDSVHEALKDVSVTVSYTDGESQQ